MDVPGHDRVSAGRGAGLRWKDVDLTAATAAIRQTVVNVGDAIVISEPKAKSTRLLALDPGTVKVLRRWLARQAEERARKCRTAPPNGGMGQPGPT